SRPRRCTRRSRPSDCERSTTPPIPGPEGSSAPDRRAISGGTILAMSEATTTGPRAVLAAERERLTSELAALGVDRGTFDEGFADSGRVTAARDEVDTPAR